MTQQKDEAPNMTLGSKKGGLFYFCSGCIFTGLLILMLSNNNNRLMMLHSHPVYHLAAHVQSENEDHNFLVDKLQDNKQRNIPDGQPKKVFNFGEVMRGSVKTNDDQDDINISKEQMEYLKSQNLCPKRYQLDSSVTQKYTKLAPISNWTLAKNDSSDIYGNKINSTLVNIIINEHPPIVILTPLSNEADRLQHFFSLLCSLTYPHDRISIVIGEDSSKDKSYELAHVHARTLTDYFQRVEAVHFDEGIGKESHFGKHDEFYQLYRRGHMARSRNKLLFHGLRTEDYVLWIDSDITYIPSDIIQHLLAADKDIIVPSCMTLHPQSPLMVYDRNSWRETPRSLAFLEKQSSDFLKLEGYTVSMRDLLPDIKDEGHIVSLDGVGGCVVLVKADCHRKGLIFPPFVFQHHIETEGLAKMAKAMGFEVFGYPFTYVIHV